LDFLARHKTETMNHDLIRAWLDLPAGAWPPEPHALLGLPPGEADVHLIEQRVHERMDKVRRYQLTHPELATEAMNCLARALVTLTEKQRPAAAPAPAPAVEPAPVVVAVTEAPPPPVRRSGDPIGWLFGTPTAPVAQQQDWATTPPPARVPATPATAEPMTAVTAPVAPSTESSDRLVLVAQSSSVARRGLGTKRALYNRIALTRRLLQAWARAGRYLSEPEDRIARPQDATDLRRQLDQIRLLLKEFPPLLGHASQPGYHILTLARQPEAVPTYKKLAPGQREVLARDWQAGNKVLQAHRAFLRQEVRALRRGSAVRRATRAAGSLVSEHLARILLSLGLLALCLALMADQVLIKERQTAVLPLLLGFVAVNVAVWWSVLWPASLPRPVPDGPPRPRPRVQRQPN
jgi:hypothetical protein